MVFLQQLKQHGSFDVTYMAWEDFRDLLLHDDDVIEKLTGAYSVLLGGANVGQDLT